MRTITDLHIHSRFSRACSQDLTIPNLAEWATRKGINFLGTGDFTHPKWLEELERDLEEVAPGTYTARGVAHPARFLLTSEVACIYKRGGKVRRVHLILVAPNLAAVGRLCDALRARGCNLNADGRPILGLDAEELLKMMLEIDPQFLLIPAHAWTPWFAIFGSASGFDALTECFGENVKYIYAIETGLSSDPAMNWRLRELDNRLILSNSDAHSLRNLGREASVFDLPERTFAALREAIVERQKGKLVETIEFFPEEGKYHLDGHADCGVRLLPQESARTKGKCPVCAKQLTIGVLARVEAIANRPLGEKPETAIPFRSIVPLQLIIAECLGVGTASKKVQATYMDLTDKVGNEFFVLLEASIPVISAVAGERVAEAIRRVRAGELTVLGGYDGIYGTVRIFSDEEKKAKKQRALL